MGLPSILKQFLWGTHKNLFESLLAVKTAVGWTSLRHGKTTYATTLDGRCHKEENFICFVACFWLIFILFCYSQTCLKEQWRSTVHCQLNICSTGHLFVCLWSNTQRKWAKHAPERWWARKPRVKWSPTWEKEGPRPRLPGLGRKWLISFYTN